MSKKGGNPQNLKAPLSPEEARKFGQMGGKRSVEVRRERKLLSQMYAEQLAKGFEVSVVDDKGNVKKEPLTLDEVTGSILARRDSSSVAMLKEIREATEGSRVALNTDDLFKAFADVEDIKARKIANLEEPEL